MRTNAPKVTFTLDRDEIARISQIVISSAGGKDALKFPRRIG